MRTHRDPRAFLLLPLLLAAAACDDGPAAALAPPEPWEVVKLAGDLQAGPVAGALPVPLEVRVLDPDGEPLRGAVLTWTPCGRGGTVTGVDTVTGPEGLARATWVLGTTTGLRSVTVRAGDRMTVFNGTALPGPPAGLEAVSGDAQTGPAGERLPVRLRVRVLDAHGNGVGGADVAWRVTAGGGRVTDAEGVAGPDGVAGAGWILGEPGPQRLEARSGDAMFTFIATAG